MGPAALARAPRLRSVPMTTPFCPGEPAEEGGRQVPQASSPQSEWLRRLTPACLALELPGLIYMEMDHKQV